MHRSKKKAASQRNASSPHAELKVRVGFVRARAPSARRTGGGRVVHFFNLRRGPEDPPQADRNSADRLLPCMSPKLFIHAALCSRVIGTPFRSSQFELYACVMTRGGQGRREHDESTAVVEGPSTSDGASRSRSR